MLYIIGGPGWPHKSSSSVTTHSSTVKLLDCNRKRQVSPESTSLQTLSFSYTQSEISQSGNPALPVNFYFILLIAASFLHVISFPYPHISNHFVGVFLCWTTCPAAVWLHLTLLSHYRCDLNPFTASTLPSTDGYCCAADWCWNKKETSFLPLQVCFSIYL